MFIETAGQAIDYLLNIIDGYIVVDELYLLYNLYEVKLTASTPYGQVL